jgi:hypothetical protein
MTTARLSDIRRLISFTVTDCKKVSPDGIGGGELVDVCIVNLGRSIG